MSLRFETIAIGDEILTGKISDTNSAYVGAELLNRGFVLSKETVVADDAGAILAALDECSKRADIVVCFGGLGPTSDDKTAEVVASRLQCKLIDHVSSRERLMAYYNARNREVTSQSLKQVLYPEKAEALSNPRGMAPAFRCQLGRGEFFFLPGVPVEMRAIFEEHLLPRFLQRAEKEGVARLRVKTWRCLGIWESELQRLMDPVENTLPSNAWLGYRTKTAENHLTLYYRSGAKSGEFEAISEKIRSLLSPFTFTEEPKDLEEIVGEKLFEKKLSLCVVESCTGGLVSRRITSVAGSSRYFWGGLVTYDRKSKHALLGVEVATDEAAVSARCSEALAKSALQKSGCDLAVAITGWMGPDGGTPEDPAGTVYVCVAGKKGVRESRVSVTAKSREDAQWSAATHALNEVRIYLAK